MHGRLGSTPTLADINYSLLLIALRGMKLLLKLMCGFFNDFTSLFQYERLLSEEERSFRAAMANMHIMYAHECTMTFIIEHLTPTDMVGINNEK